MLSRSALRPKRRPSAMTRTYGHVEPSERRKAASQALKEAFNLSDGEEKYIVNAKIGQGILVTQEGRIPFYNSLSDEERSSSPRNRRKSPLDCTVIAYYCIRVPSGPLLILSVPLLPSCIAIVKRVQKDLGAEYTVLFHADAGNCHFFQEVRGYDCAIRILR